MLPYRDADIAELAGEKFRSGTTLPRRDGIHRAGRAARRSGGIFSVALRTSAASCNPAARPICFCDNLNRHRDALRERGWRFGRARLAVRAADNAARRRLRLLRLVHDGCPYGCIYNAADTVRELRAEKNFTYQRDVIVTTLREDAGKVFIEGFHRETRAPLAFEADRVYLAAGVIPTAQILVALANRL